MGCHTSLITTAEYRLLALGPHGEAIPHVAGRFAQALQAGSTCALYNGRSFLMVAEAEQCVKTTALVEVSFGSGDAAALVWLLPRRRRSSSAGGVPVAVLGMEPTMYDHGCIQSNTFWDHRRSIGDLAPDAGAKRRSLSAGSAPDPRSCWSAGTVKHDPSHPEKCHVCPFHHRYLLDLDGPNAKEATPCKKGPACMQCHARHDELGRLREY